MPMLTTHRRLLNSLGLLVCLGLLGYAYYAQMQLHLEPCPLCIFQRIGVAALAVVFLLAAVHNPIGWGARVYGTLILLAAVLTLAVAARHVWIQHLPADQVPTCGASLNYMIEIFPLSQVIRTVLTGSGECAQVSWRFLTLSMPTWVAIAMLGLGSLGFFANIRCVKVEAVRF
jgi:disulfide bond formation protein DsbB